ncbi:glycosyltransferase [Rivularia sp. PCC 7116]|uniref:glycosyltransferase family 4 protein n=1 Tax=Rivularia sp. PCC 7116 TaxID=373994 RepID=UPI00029F3ADA|nr:glycosyltransferase family 4 protein [Rivularia sp. PCC 7116]AFY59071.1 glycosyltransferase [Rivularia sp. PCC 7116]
MSKLNILMLGASLEQNGGIATVEKLILKHNPEDVNYQHITTHDEGTILHRIKVFIKACRALLWNLMNGKADILHVHISDGGSLVRKAIIAVIAFIFNKPILMHAHGAEFQTTYSKLPLLAQLVLSKIFRSCDKFIVLSKNWEEYYTHNLGLKKQQVVVLPNPTELPIQIPNRIHTSSIKFGFCGRIGSRKGTFDLIQAFATMPQSLRERSELIIAGDGDIEPACRLVEKLEIKDRVRFLGWIDSQAREKLLTDIDIFVLPSYNEGLPMALLEAMAWGLPVVVTPVGGIPELITSAENGLLVAPGDIQQLSKNMQQLVENQPLRVSLGSAARQSVIPLDVKAYCTEMYQIYNSAIDCKSRKPSILYPYGNILQRLLEIRI